MTMIYIQIEHEGPWIKLIRAMTSFDLGIGEAERILTAGVWGIRLVYTDASPTSPPAWEARRVGPDSKQFMWRSGAMATFAFADLPARPWA